MDLSTRYRTCVTVILPRHESARRIGLAYYVRSEKANQLPCCLPTVALRTCVTLRCARHPPTTHNVEATQALQYVHDLSTVSRLQVAHSFPYTLDTTDRIDPLQSLPAVLSIGTIMCLMSLIKPLMTIFGFALSSEFVFTLLIPKPDTAVCPLIALLALNLLLILTWYAMIWSTCTVSFIARVIIHKQKPTTSIIWQQYRSYQRDLQAFATVRLTHERWSRAGLTHLLILAICGPSNILKPAQHQAGNGFLPLLPRRSDPAPNITSIDYDVYNDLHQCIDHLDTRNITLFQGPIFLQSGATILQARCNRITSPRFRMYGSEIAHWDEGNGRLYLTLHADDIKAVIDAGWGELHPLARTGAIWTCFFATFAKRAPVPASLTVIYPPKSTKDVEVVMEMIEATVLFVADPKEIFTDECTGCENYHPSNVS